MKRVIALVFVMALLAATVFAPAASAIPGNSQGKGPGNGQATPGACNNPGLSSGANEKCFINDS